MRRRHRLEQFLSRFWQIFRFFRSVNPLSATTRFSKTRDAVRKISPSETRLWSMENAGASQPLEILVVDVNPVIRALISGWLEEFGHRTRAATGAAEALKQVASAHYELVFLNPYMMESGGHKVAARLRAVSLNSSLSLVALIPPGIAPLPAEELESRGFHSVIHAPFSRANLRAALLGRPMEKEEPREPELKSLELAFKGFEEVAAKLIHDFLTQAPVFLAKIKEAIEKNDPSGLEESAHSLAGSLSYFREEKILSVARKLERMGASGNLRGAMNVYDALCAETTLLESALGKFTRKKAA